MDVARHSAGVETLVIHPGALGDVLLAVPALRALRRDGRQIVIAAQPRIGALLVTLGEAARAVAFDSLGLEALFGEAPPDADAPLTRLLLGAPRVVCWFAARDEGFTRRLRALAPDAVIAPPAVGGALVWRHLLRTVSGSSDADRPPIAPASEVVDAGRRALRAIGWNGSSRILMLHPGAGGVAKQWPAEGFVDVLAAVDATVVVHQGPADVEAVQAFLAQVRRPVLRLIDPALPTLAGVMAAATAYLGNDSGVSHLAAAVGAPSVILFTDALRPWAPWSPTARCLTVTTATVRERDRDAVAAALRPLIHP